MEKYHEILKSSKLFCGIGKSELSKMLDCLSYFVKQYNKGEYIFEHGDSIKKVGLVLSGSVHIVKEDFWGNTSILSEIVKGGLFGESFALSSANQITVCAVAVKPSEIMFLDIDRLLTTCQNSCPFHNTLIKNLIIVLADKNILLSEKIEYLSERKTRDKILAYLSECSTKEANSFFTIPFSRQQLADYLCVDRSALSNELCKLRNEGLLEFEKNEFKLL